LQYKLLVSPFILYADTRSGKISEDELDTKVATGREIDELITCSSTRLAVVVEIKADAAIGVNTALI
jgi:hypothetical protein